MNSICVFLGSSSGNDPVYLETAGVLGRELARRHLTCIYGGSRTGLMNRLAESALAAGGTVIGVAVQALKDREEFHPGLTELHVLPTMHERKHRMVQLADGFVALPGGIGTFEEFFEVCTLQQMGFHSKPCGLLNVNGFFRPLELMLETAQKEGFLKQSLRSTIFRSTNAGELLDRMMNA